jgi:hypothetical protein
LEPSKVIPVPVEYNGIGVFAVPFVAITKFATPAVVERVALGSVKMMFARMAVFVEQLVPAAT